MTEEPSPSPPAPPDATPTSRRSSIPPAPPTRALLGRSFELLARSNDDMRRASFYIGAVALGTIGPFALATWGLAIVTLDRSEVATASTYLTAEPLLTLLVLLAVAGVAVAAVESRTLAAAILGGRMADRAVTTRQALARSRTSFWGAVAASIIVALPVSLAQAVFGALLPLDAPEELVAATSTAVAAIVGAPFAYILAGIVLGGVGPIESTRRSFLVFRARRLAAVLVAAIESIVLLLLILGVGAGLDIVARVASVLGLGPASDAGGLALATGGIVAITFALGTLLFTVYAIIIAPQVVMFVGLTHATFGLDRVQAGGPDDPDVRRPGRPVFRWFTRPMLAGFVLGAGLTAVLLAQAAG
jgi:hypothetical protein